MFKLLVRAGRWGAGRGEVLGSEGSEHKAQ